MKILVLLEHDNKNIKSTNYHTLMAAQEISQNIDILIVGHQCEAVVSQAQKIPNINKIIVASAAEYEYQLAENVAILVAELTKNYHYLLASATTVGKNILPRIAALLDSAMIADVIKIIAPDTFVRPIYAGNALATVQSSDAIKILSIRSTAYAAIELIENNTAVVENLATIIPNHLSYFKSRELSVLSRPELTTARIIVSGGRGLKSAENFKLLEALADRLGAAVGASRAAVDAGFAPNDYQVGQTGKIVAPDLYIAIGISGAIQHLAGMKDSKVIVAINSDPDAPIFQIADYGLVADLFTVLQQLEHLF